jgi:large subunit ribosomal protein L22
MEAKASGRNIGISRKDSVEVANFIRGKMVSKAKILLEGVIAKDVVVPYRRYNRDRGHKRGKVAAGRYPVKTSTEVLKLIESAEANAVNKGMNADELFISEIIANKGNGQMHHGRKRGREMKRTHLEIKVQEIKRKKKETKKQ